MTSFNLNYCLTLHIVSLGVNILHTSRKCKHTPHSYSAQSRSPRFFVIAFLSPDVMCMSTVSLWKRSPQPCPQGEFILRGKARELGGLTEPWSGVTGKLQWFWGKEAVFMLSGQGRPFCRGHVPAGNGKAPRTFTWAVLCCQRWVCGGGGDRSKGAGNGLWQPSAEKGRWTSVTGRGGAVSSHLGNTVEPPKCSVSPYGCGLSRRHREPSTVTHVGDSRRC